MTAFWDVAPCSLVEVDCISEVRTASIISVIMAALHTNRPPEDVTLLTLIRLGYFLVMVLVFFWGPT
jgi:hypothetical protein